LFIIGAGLTKARHYIIGTTRALGLRPVPQSKERRPLESGRLQARKKSGSWAAELHTKKMCVCSLGKPGRSMLRPYWTSVKRTSSLRPYGRRRLVAVGDAVDYADAVVGNEQGAVGRGGYAYWSAIHEVTLGVGH